MRSGLSGRPAIWPPINCSFGRSLLAAGAKQLSGSIV